MTLTGLLKVIEILPTEFEYMLDKFALIYIGGEVEILKFALWALCNLSQDNRACIRFGELGLCGVCETILSKLHEVDVAVTQLTCSAISVLCLDESNKCKFKSLDGALGTAEKYYSQRRLAPGVETLLEVIEHTQQRLATEGRLEPEVIPYDVSDASVGFALRMREESLAGIDLKRPISMPARMGKSMSKRLSMTLDGMIAASNPLISSPTSPTKGTTTSPTSKANMRRSTSAKLVI